MVWLAGLAALFRGFPAGGSGFFCYSLTFIRAKGFGSGLSTLLATNATEGHCMGVSAIWRRSLKWSAVHLLTDRMLYNVAGDLHEVALRA